MVAGRPFLYDFLPEREFGKIWSYLSKTSFQEFGLGPLSSYRNHTRGKRKKLLQLK